MRALKTFASMTLAFLLCSCGAKEDPAIICHNSNCVEPPDPEQDDSPEALRESLNTLDDAGQPIIDGMEMDLFLRGSDNQCVFAHDLNQVDPATALDAANIVAEWLKTPRAKVTRKGGPFWVFLELKGQVGKTKAEVHSAAQIDIHAACARDVLGVIADAARTANIPLRARFISFSPDLLRATSNTLNKDGWVNDEQVAVGYGAIQGVLPPLDWNTQPLDNYGKDIPIDMVTVHAQWMRDSVYQAYLSRGWSVSMWMFSAVPETYDAIEMYEPQWVTTNEAKTFARWLDR